MKPFHSIAVPHKDILDKKLSMEVFAADLWEMHTGRAPAEYRDKDLFFEKTYITQGLKDILSVVETRLKGNGGDPVIQIQTPFGGGKTHSLIAMYHKAIEWHAKRVVIVGTALDAENNTLWGEIEKQLTGKVGELRGRVSPGRDKIRNLLDGHKPVLILMDEVLQFVTRAAGVPVGETTLSAQTIAFMQEITEVVSSMQNVCMVITLPSSEMEHYDQNAEKLFNQLQKVTGRVEKIYTPVQDNEVSRIIRKRLFSDINKEEMEEVVKKFVKYAETEGILPSGQEVSEYRDRFLSSYPFLPEVIDVFYHRWGSFPTFQRTRGVLRILSLLLYSMRNSERSYVSLSDFDLQDQEIRRELVNYIGPEYDTVIASDITDYDSGSKKVDSLLGQSNAGLRYGTRASTSIFLYSFSGGEEQGALLNEIKRSVISIGATSAIVAEALEKMKNNLFYLQSKNDRYQFTNKPNLNRLLLIRMENVKEEDINAIEKGTISKFISGKPLKVFLWPNKPRDITDSPDFKLVVLPDKNIRLLRDILDTKGEGPRVYRNTVFYLVPYESERIQLLNHIKKRLAYESMLRNIGSNKDQLKDVKDNLKEEAEAVEESVKRSYRLLLLPGKDNFKEVDLGIPTFGEFTTIDQYVYSILKENNEILDKISPLVLKEKYLEKNSSFDYTLLHEAMLKTAGERRVSSIDVLEESIKNGVRESIFGLGELDSDGKPVCKFFKSDIDLSLGYHVVLSSEICSSQREEKEGDTEQTNSKDGKEEGSTISPEPKPIISGAEGKRTDEVEIGYKNFTLRFSVPKGRVNSLMDVLNLIQRRFDNVTISIGADEGNITKFDYENKIKEALRQLGFDIIEERKS